MDGTIRAFQKSDVATSFNQNEIARLIVQLDSARSVEAKLADAKGYVNQGNYKAAMAEYIGLMDDQVEKAEDDTREMLKGINDTNTHLELAFYCKTRGREGSAAALSILGSIYFSGYGYKQDSVKAVKYFQKAHDKGLLSATLKVVAMHLKGEGVEKDVMKGHDYCKLAADQGSAIAQFMLGAMYLDGVVVAKDEKESFKWAKAAADQGFAVAQNQVAAMYVKGLGVAKDFGEAFKWTKAAADQGLDKAQYNLGVMYRQGFGVAREIFSAIAYFKKADEKGFEPAFDQLLQLCLSGMVKGHDPVLSLAVLEKAANRGQVIAKTKFAEEAYEYAYNLQMGKGATKDMTKALHYYEKSDEHGYFLAPAALAFMHESATNNIKNELAIYRLYKSSYLRGYLGVVDKLIELSSNDMVKKEDAAFLSGFLQHFAGRGYQPAIHKLAGMACTRSDNGRLNSVADPIIIKIEDDVEFMRKSEFSSTNGS